MREDAPQKQEQEHELGAFAGALYACAIGLVLWLVLAWALIRVL